jgi:signal recognition particle GTPase
MTKRTAEKFMMKMLGENDIESLLKRLDRLTQEEDVAAGAQTLQGVQHLLEHTKVAIDGTISSNMFFDRC